MEGLLLFLFTGGVFIGMYLILDIGYRSIEAERATSETTQAARQVLQQPRFFAKAEETAPAEQVPLVPAHLIAQLEQRLRLEYADASRFASQPSKEGICDGYAAYVDAMAGDLGRHIQRESAATTAFVARPSLERLFSNPKTETPLQ
ncbi:MAG: hypothetical protein OEV00_04305 [Acidobacteriota bacterium]|nr:hypothetical protein [Acidobacteriota bacterium]MDH3784535.1 hypothetical protein [Acidobacteriota bacterium]